MILLCANRYATLCFTSLLSFSVFPEIETFLKHMFEFSSIWMLLNVTVSDEESP